MTILAEAMEEIADQGLELRRAWPAGPTVLHLEVLDSGVPLAGQFCSDADLLQKLLKTYPRVTESRGRLLLQPNGVDRQLKTLAGRLLRGTCELISHRPERRAVLRTGTGANSCYTKVVRAKRKQMLLDSSLVAASLPLLTPAVLTHDSDSVTIRAVPGRPLHELFAGVSAGLGRQIGEMLRELHRTPVPTMALPHDAAAEAAVTADWCQRAAEWDIKLPDILPSGTCGPGERVLLHRDLHDKQIIVDLTESGPTIGLIDFDLLTVGDAALDLANLLVHLELRVAQGHSLDAGAWRHQILQGYQPSDLTRTQLPWYEQQTRLRLAAVYGFRPGQAHRLLVDQLEEAK